MLEKKADVLWELALGYLSQQLFHKTSADFQICAGFPWNPQINKTFQGKEKEKVPETHNGFYFAQDNLHIFIQLMWFTNLALHCALWI